MHPSARRFTVTLFSTLACLCLLVACGDASRPTLPPPPVLASDTPTPPPITATVHAAETANAAAFTAQAEARILTTPIPFPLPPAPTAPPTVLPPIPLGTPTLDPAASTYRAAYPLISAHDLIAQPGHYLNLRFSVIGYVGNVHARMENTTFFLASDAQGSERIFVSLAGSDGAVREGAQIAVYGTGAGTIRVVSSDNMDQESPFMDAVLVRPVR